jgi:hypothetical protein
VPVGYNGNDSCSHARDAHGISYPAVPRHYCYKL